MDSQMPRKSRPGHPEIIFTLVLILLFCCVAASGQTVTNPKSPNATAGKQVTKSQHTGTAKSKEELDMASAEAKKTLDGYTNFVNKYPGTKRLRILTGEVTSSFGLDHNMPIWSIAVNGDTVSEGLKSEDAVRLGVAENGDANISAKTLPLARVVQKSVSGAWKTIAVFPADPAVLESVLEASKNGDLPKLEELLKSDPALVTIRDSKAGATPLHFAAACSDQGATALLLSHHASVTAKDKEGFRNAAALGRRVRGDGLRTSAPGKQLRHGGQGQRGALTPRYLLGENDWKEVQTKNTVQGYLDFATANPDSPHIKVVTGTLRGRYWKSMGKPTMENGQLTFSGGGDGVLLTVAGTSVLKKLTVEEAVSSGLIGSVPESSVRKGTVLKTPATTFDTTSFELQGPCLAGFKSTGASHEIVPLLLKPRDISNAGVVLGSNETQLLAWDTSNGKIDDNPDTSKATYPDSIRQPSHGFNPEKQTVTFTQTKQ